MGSTGRTVASGTSPRGTTATSPNPNPIPTNPVNQGNPDVQNQVPDSNNTLVTPNALTNLTAMDDDQMAAVVNAAKGVQMPNFLNDLHGRQDRTQEFVFQIGLNELPQVLDSTQFAQFMADNGLAQRHIMSRSVNGTSYVNNDGTQVKLSGDQINEIIRSSRLNYIGGKRGGQAYGAGTYFEVNGGGNTGYGGVTMNAVLNPATARLVNDIDLSRRAAAWSVSHPKTAAAIGRFNGTTQSIYALCMGYNVIVSGNADPRKVGRGDYVNVIDRSALVIRK